MKVLVVGGGGREHALVWKIAQSPKVTKIYCAPGNSAISEQATMVPIKANDLNSLLEFALKERVDLTVVGPEDPLTQGIVDLFESKGLFIFGANRKAAEIEGSKAFAKEIMKKYYIPTAFYEIFDNRNEAVKYIRRQGAPIVIKADGLAAGKGVMVCKTVEEAIQSVDKIMLEKIFGEAGHRVVVEEYLVAISRPRGRVDLDAFLSTRAWRSASGKVPTSRWAHTDAVDSSRTPSYAFFRSCGSPCGGSRPVNH